MSEQNPEEIEAQAIQAGFRPLYDFAQDLKPGDVVEVVVDEFWRGDLCVKAKQGEGGWVILDDIALARKSSRGIGGA